MHLCGLSACLLHSCMGFHRTLQSMLPADICTLGELSATTSSEACLEEPNTLVQQCSGLVLVYYRQKSVLLVSSLAGSHSSNDLASQSAVDAFSAVVRCASCIQSTVPLQSVPANPADYTLRAL